MVKRSRNNRYKAVETGEMCSGATSRSTVSRRLQRAGLQERVAAQLNEQWSKLHFTYESKFNIFGFHGKAHVDAKIRERLSLKYVKKT